jgi:hypothetical protein
VSRPHGAKHRGAPGSHPPRAAAAAGAPVRPSRGRACRRSARAAPRPTAPTLPRPRARARPPGGAPPPGAGAAAGAAGAAPFADERGAGGAGAGAPASAPAPAADAPHPKRLHFAILDNPPLPQALLLGFQVAPRAAARLSQAPVFGRLGRPVSPRCWPPILP